MRQVWIRLARVVEGWMERIGRKSADPVLDPYIGYATPEGWVLRARVLTHLRRTTATVGQSTWANLRNMVSLFITDEVAGATVRARGVTAVSDAEGYVTMLVPAAEGPDRWVDVPMQIDGALTAAICRVRVPDATSRYLIISDIDDTMIETGAHSLARNLWTTFTGSILTRRAHPDAVRLMEALTEDGFNPVFYVSSSPWNLHAFLDAVFRRSNLPLGPVFLRDLGVSRSGGIGDSHKDHKSAAIDTILAAEPDLPAILLGDTGQKDAKIYADVVKRYPGRVIGVALREPAEGESRDDRAAVEAIRAAGVPCHVGPSFDGAGDLILGPKPDTPHLETGS